MADFAQLDIDTEMAVDAMFDETEMSDVTDVNEFARHLGLTPSWNEDDFFRDSEDVDFVDNFMKELLEKEIECDEGSASFVEGELRYEEMAEEIWCATDVTDAVYLEQLKKMQSQLEEALAVLKNHIYFLEN